MKFAFLVFATMIASFAQTPIKPQPAKPQKVMPLPIKMVNEAFMKRCADGERLFEKIQKGEEKELVKLFELVTDLDYRLIDELDKRTESEKKELKGASICTKSITKRTSVYFGQLIKKIPLVSKMQ